MSSALYDSPTTDFLAFVRKHRGCLLEFNRLPGVATCIEHKPMTAVTAAETEKRMPVTRDNVEDVFTYHPPDDQQKVAYENIREGAKAFARTILDNTPTCADQQAALRELRVCVMTAFAAVALKGGV